MQWYNVISGNKKKDPKYIKLFFTHYFKKLTLYYWEASIDHQLKNL